MYQATESATEASNRCVALLQVGQMKSRVARLQPTASGRICSKSVGSNLDSQMMQYFILGA